MAKKTLTQSTVTTNNIQSQPDQVIDQASALKLSFDQYGIDSKQYNNVTLLSELADESSGNSGSNTIGHNSAGIIANNVGDALQELADSSPLNIANDSITELKMVAAMKKQAGGVAEFDDVAEMQPSVLNTNLFNNYEGRVSPKIFYQTLTADTVLVITRDLKDEYLLYTTKRDLVTLTSSYGAPGDLQRVTKILKCLDAIVYKHTYSAEVSVDGWDELSYNYPNGYTSSKPFKFWNAVNTATILATDYLEFETVIKEDGKFNVAFLKTGASTPNAEVQVNGVTMGTFDLSVGTGTIIKEFVSNITGAVTIRVLVGTAAKNLYVAGVNYSKLKDYNMVDEVDDFGYWLDDTQDYISTEGAMDYALREESSGLLCGSYHGGETLISRDYVIDGVVKTPGLGGFEVAKSIDFVQSTDIISALTSDTLTRWKADGLHDFIVHMYGSLIVNTIYTVMTTTNDDFTEVLIPEQKTITLGNEYVFGRTNVIEQKNPTTGQAIKSVFTLFGEESNRGVEIRSVIGAYNKVYYGKYVFSSEPKEITDIKFQNTRIITE